MQSEARVEPIQKCQPQAVQCGMMGARIEHIQKPQPPVKPPAKPQPQVVQCGMMGARIVPIEQMKGKGVENSRSQQQRQQRQQQLQQQQLQQQQRQLQQTCVSTLQVPVTSKSSDFGQLRRGCLLSLSVIYNHPLSYCVRNLQIVTSIWSRQTCFLYPNICSQLYSIHLPDIC